ncbi:TPA: transcriptional regulator [Raoultella ornithinolytica]|uniref:winged helix-turn-helix domain-containing protein n=1 Tax=Raoultella ornithinolytica TaxID=54291 RepID=UPI0037289B19
MKYIINGTVQFLVAERKLTGNGGVEVILSNPACRLLIVFLEHNHQQVSREILLEKVWEDFGLVSSESSLNNSISSLRRGLRDVGIDNTIETVPKKGFEFHVDDLLLENITADFLINNMESEAVVGSGVKTKPKSLLKNHGQIIFSALFVLFILFSVLLFYKEKKPGVQTFRSCWKM